MTTIRFLYLPKARIRRGGADAHNSFPDCVAAAGLVDMLPYLLERFARVADTNALMNKQGELGA